MIRNRLKKAARRLLGRTSKKEEPTPAPPATPVPAPAAPTPVLARKAANWEKKQIFIPEDEEGESSPNNAQDLEIDSALVADWEEEGKQYLFVDIREPLEMKDGYIRGAYLLPMGELKARSGELPRDKALVVYCAGGDRSLQIAGMLREMGVEDAWSMTGGFGSWIAQGGSQILPSREASFKPAQEVLVAEGEFKGTIQHIEEVDGEFLYTIGIASDEGGFELLEEIKAAEITKA